MLMLHSNYKIDKKKHFIRLFNNIYAHGITMLATGLFRFSQF